MTVLRTPGVRAEFIGSARPSPPLIRAGDSERTGDKPLLQGSPTIRRAPLTGAPLRLPSHPIHTMLTRRSPSPFALFDHLEQQLSQQLQTAERVPAAEVHETPQAFEVVLELPGVDKGAIAVKATERTLLVSAQRRSQRPPAGHPAGLEASAGEIPALADQAQGPRSAQLLSEFRYGTWSRSFRFPVAIDREQLQAVYRDGLLTVTAPKAHKVSTVTVKVEG